MSDLYSELLIKRNSGAKEMVIRVGMIAVTALLVVAGLFIDPIILLGAVALGVADYFVFPMLDLEYEYLQVNGELDVDKIMSRSKRKKVISIDLEKTEVVAPLGSHQLDPYKNAKQYDYSANDPQQKPYVLVISDKSETKKIVLQLDDTMLQEMKRRMPRKVFND